MGAAGKNVVPHNRTQPHRTNEADRHVGTDDERWRAMIHSLTPEVCAGRAGRLKRFVMLEKRTAASQNETAATKLRFRISRFNSMLLAAVRAKSSLAKMPNTAEPLPVICAPSAPCSSRSFRKGATSRPASRAAKERSLPNVVATWRLTKYRLGARFGFATGTPYTPIVGGVARRVYDPSLDHWGTGDPEILIESMGGARNSARFPSTHRIDLDASREFNVRGATVAPYLSVVNAYNAKNVFVYLYQYSTNPPTRRAMSQFPVLPSLGVRVAF